MKSLQAHEIPGHVTVTTGHGGLPAIQINTDWSLTEVYPHGAHVTGFQLKGSAPDTRTPADQTSYPAPLLFLSAASEFHADKPIRGGVPVIFPWFGPRDGMPAHGHARLTDWELLETAVLPDGSIRLHFRLPSNGCCTVDYFVTTGRSLGLEMVVTNTRETDYTFENCLHTYFQVGAVESIEITGLQGARYLDLLLAAEFTESGDPIRIAAEIDRTYQNTRATVEISDPVLARTIRIRKSGSLSTVVWNPWTAKSKRMPDFGDEEYRQMVCVESGNIGENAITLAPGQRSSMKVEIDCL
jgi:D-hexose-6-phosphate mutarotase